MRGIAAILLVAACYAPNAPANAPCDPVSPHCPSGQTCVGTAGFAVCSATGVIPDAPLGSMIDSSLLLDAAVDGSPVIDAHGADAPMLDAKLLDAAPIDTAMPLDAMAPPLHLDYHAVVADCIDPLLLGPLFCTQQNGVAQLVVDNKDTLTLQPWQGYVRFDLDGQLAGRTITAVSLVMVATSDAKAASPESGEVWTVGAFTHASLSISAPAQLAKVAASQGSVAALQTVTWPLPITTVAPNGSVYLGLVSANDDGVNYWNLAGPNPPILHVDAQ